MEKLRDAKEAQPDAALAQVEEYLWAVGQIPQVQARLDCWIFARSFGDRAQACSDDLEDFLVHRVLLLMVCIPLKVLLKKNCG